MKNFYPVFFHSGHGHQIIIKKVIVSNKKIFLCLLIVLHEGYNIKKNYVPLKNLYDKLILISIKISLSIV